MELTTVKKIIQRRKTFCGGVEIFLVNIFKWQKRNLTDKRSKLILLEVDVDAGVE